MKLVLEGWLADKRRTPVCALSYFYVRDCLSVMDEILVKGEAAHGSETINQEKTAQCPSRP